MIEIVAARRFALIVEASEQRKILCDLVYIVRATAGYGAKFALANQALSEI